LRLPRKNADEFVSAVKTSVSLKRSELDFRAWIDALGNLPLAPITESEILVWIEGPLRRFFPFERFLGAYGHLSGGRIGMRSLLTSGYPSEFLSNLENVFDLKSRGCFAWWTANRKAFILDKTGALDEAGVHVVATRRELEEIERFSLGVIAAHGVIDPFAKAAPMSAFLAYRKAGQSKL
jgi:hypothetical protein